MITIGITQFLNINRLTDFGLFLGDDEGNEVLLPNKYVPKVYEIGGRPYTVNFTKLAGV